MEEPPIPELHNACFLLSLWEKCPKAYALVASLIRQKGHSSRVQAISDIWEEIPLTTFGRTALIMWIEITGMTPLEDQMKNNLMLLCAMWHNCSHTAKPSHVLPPPRAQFAPLLLCNYYSIICSVIQWFFISLTLFFFLPLHLSHCS